MSQKDFPVLLKLASSELKMHALSTDFPKWASLCMLRLLELPTLNAAMLLPSTNMNFAQEAITAFASQISSLEVMLRSDGGREKTNYYRGGNTFDVTRAGSIAAQLLRAGRCVILVEPTNRFGNRLSVSVRVDPDGKWFLETLGPGFDASDLQRGDVPPQYYATGLSIEATLSSSSSNAAIRVIASEHTPEQMSSRRLEKIAHQVLPQITERDLSYSVEFAMLWLAQQGRFILQEAKRFHPSTKELRNVLGDAYLVKAWLDSNLSPQSFVLAYSRLEDGRRVYWDVTLSTMKWQSKL